MRDLEPLGIPEIKARHHAVEQQYLDAPSEILCYWCGEDWPCMTGEVLDAYERQQADLEACRTENGRLISALKPLADYDRSYDDAGYFCTFCDVGNYSGRPLPPHEADCPVLAARAALQSREGVA